MKLARISWERLAGPQEGPRFRDLSLAVVARLCRDEPLPGRHCGGSPDATRPRLSRSLSSYLVTDRGNSGRLSPLPKRSNLHEPAVSTPSRPSDTQAVSGRAQRLLDRDRPMIHRDAHGQLLAALAGPRARQRAQNERPHRSAHRSLHRARTYSRAAFAGPSGNPPQVVECQSRPGENPYLAAW